MMKTRLSCIRKATDALKILRNSRFEMRESDK